MTNVERPSVVRDEHLNFLSGLRNNDSANMLGTATLLQEMDAALSQMEVCAVLAYWMTWYPGPHNNGFVPPQRSELNRLVDFIRRDSR